MIWNGAKGAFTTQAAEKPTIATSSSKARQALKSGDISEQPGWALVKQLSGPKKQHFANNAFYGSGL